MVHDKCLLFFTHYEYGKGRKMQMMTESPTLPALPRAQAKPASPATLTTTLYDLIAALQEAAGPDADDLVVATVLHLIDSGRLTWQWGTQKCCLVVRYSRTWKI
jgi:hypothetical protein